MARPPSARRSWLQFSLRGLLLVMTLVGVGLVVYRWPWVVEAQLSLGPTEVSLQRELTEPFLRQLDGAAVKLGPRWNPEAFLNPSDFRHRRHSHQRVSQAVKLRRQTTYRRGWNGSPEKHGAQRYWKEDGALVAEIQYFNGEQRQINRIDANGEITESSSFQDGILHGPYFCRIGPRTWQGGFQQGKKSGEWQFTYRDGDEIVQLRQPLADGVPHGDWIWFAADDQVLQSARFDAGKLVLWNGLPVEKELERWCDTRRVDQTIREALLSLHEKKEPSSLEHYRQFQHFDNDLATLPLSINGRGLLLLHSPREERSYDFLDRLDQSPAAEQTIGAWIVQESLLTSRTLDYRFGVVCVVPICSSEVHWRDRTGISRAQFPKGSGQAHYWNKFLTAEEGKRRLPDMDLGVAPELKQVVFLTPIEIDTSEITKKSLANIRNIGSLCVGTPRDILGLFLSNNGWSCEQDGDRLILHPYPAKEPEAE